MDTTTPTSKNVETVNEDKLQRELAHPEPVLPTEPPQKNERFFFINEDLVTIKVDNELFRVPAYILKSHSKKFGTFLSSQALSASAQVDSIKLRDLEAIDFERLLSVLIRRSIKEYEISTPEEWTSVLKVAHLWDFEEVRELAIETLDTLVEEVDKILLGHQYGIEKWTQNGYLRLVIREQQLTRVEGRKLGLEDVAEIAELREDWQKEIGLPQPEPHDAENPPSATDIIEKRLKSRPNALGSESGRVFRALQNHFGIPLAQPTPKVTNKGKKSKVT